MIEKNIIIEEADEALETSLMLSIKKPKQPSNFNSIFTDLSIVEKDVDQIISRIMRSSANKTQNNFQKNHQNFNSQIHHDNINFQQENWKTKQLRNDEFQRKYMREGSSNESNLNILRKYSNFGQRYRFEQREEQLKVSKAQIQQNSKSEHYFDKKHHRDDQEIKSVMNGDLQGKIDNNYVAEEDSLYMNREEVCLPSKKYYILFDQERKHSKKHSINQQNRKVFQRQNQTMDFQKKSNYSKKNIFDPNITNQQFTKSINFSGGKSQFQKSQNFGRRTLKDNSELYKNEQSYFEQKPKWFLEKKISTLEKEVKRLKQKQSKREYSSNFRMVDRKIKLNGKVDKILNDLFP